MNSNILIVEDERIVAKDLAAFLEGMGYIVCGSLSSGEETIEKVGDIKPDLILMDIMLKGRLDGIDTADRIKKHYDIPVVYITAYADETLLKRAKITQPFGYILKPIERRDVHFSIEIALLQHSLMRQTKKNEETIRTLLDFTFDCECLIDPDNNYIYISPSCERITGYSPEDFMNNPELLEHIHYPDDNDSAIKRLQEARENQESKFIEFKILTKQGEIKWIHLICRPVIREGTFQGTRVSLLDITINKENEHNLSKIKDQLAFISDNLPLVFYSYKMNHPSIEITYISPSMETVTGYSPDLIKKSPSLWLDYIYIEDRPSVISQLSRLKAGGSCKCEYRVMVHDGTCKWIKDIRRVAATKDNRLSDIVGVLIDITKEKELQFQADTLLRENIQADKLASLGEMVAVVAHEINNPVSVINYNMPIVEEIWGTHEQSIKGNALSQIEYERDKKDMLDAFGSIKEGSRRISEFICEIREFVGTHDEIKHLQINEAIVKALKFIQPQAKRYSKDIVLDLGENLPDIKGSMLRIEQIVINLLLNALQENPEGKGGRIRLSTRLIDNRSIMIQVQDIGSGISPDILPHIFEPFFTTKKNHRGTGLGLPIVKDLVTQLNGYIMVYTRPSKGTRFNIFFPLEEVIHPRLKYKIVFIDTDRHFLQEMEQMCCRFYKYSFHGLFDTRNLLPYLEEHPEVILVFSETNMPHMDGWELLDKVKEKDPLLPVVLFSSSPAGHERYGRFVPDYIFKKPIVEDQLKNALHGIGAVTI